MTDSFSHRFPGFLGARTYIASGNVVFASKASPTKVKADLEARLLAYVGKPVEVIVRTAAQMAAVVKANPFPKAAPNRTVQSSLTNRRHLMLWSVQSV
jgi:uncharacterized protein (DUF1697 family)